jgi:3-hydroxyisobutyrate dehydrogenase-like beta-hydroxyacid dehydrogenase
MGAAMAANLLAAGYHLTVWNRSTKPREQLRDAGAEVADSLDGFGSCEVVMSMLANDSAVESVLLDPQLLESAAPSSIHVNLATISPELASQLHAAYTERGLRYVAAPVFGRTDVAAAGNLTIVCAGDPTAIEAVQPLFDVLGRSTWNVGSAPQHANLVKVLGNYLLALTIGSLGEVTTVAEAAGLPAPMLIDVLTETLFAGSAHKNYGGMISRRDYEPTRFRVELGLKDVLLALDVGQQNSVPLALGAPVRDMFLDAMAHGQADDDWASVAETVRRRAGLT